MNTLRARFNLSENDNQISVGNLVHNFSITSTLHGIRYIFDKNSSIISRGFWLLWTIVSLIICIILIFNILSRWNSDPLIVNLSDKPEPIWEIPFPAITICPETKTKATLFNFTHYYQKLLKNPNRITGGETSYDSTMRTLRAVSQICDSNLMGQILSSDPNTTSAQIYDDLRNIAPNFNETAVTCFFQNELTECHQFFSEVWTDEGLCFTFNLLNDDDIISELVEQPKYSLVKRIKSHYHPKRVWTLDKGYEHSTEMDPKIYPYEILGAGKHGAFTILLQMFENDFDYVCRGSIIGYKIAIHLPGDLPQISDHFIRIPIKQETLVTIDPNVVRTDDSLRRFSPNTRGCYYPDEGTLKYFKEYTQNNCELECLADHTLRNCGCVKFSMPRDIYTPICGFGKFQCVLNSVKSIFGEKLRNFTYGIDDSCNCLPACTQITYNHAISQANLDILKQMHSLDSSAPELNTSVTYARLTIQAKNNYFTSTRRHELHNSIDLLAMCGGILALFFGASLCSILELIQYVLSRIFNWQKVSSIERHVLKDEFDTDIMG